MYLAWLDIDKHRTPAEKIAGAIAAYRARFGREPDVVLVNESELCEVPGVEVRSESYIRPGNVWVGMCPL
jgi:hypothetical protein